MPTLRRILKYTPVLAAVLLSAVWVATWQRVYACAVNIPYSHRGVSVVAGFGTVNLIIHDNMNVRLVFRSYKWEVPLSAETALGKFDELDFGTSRGLSIPIPIALAAILPFAIGSFISFRFRLWHYLAYTALVAVELAYYLRWQE